MILFTSNKTIEAHISLVLYEVAGNSHKRKGYMPKEI